MIHNRLVCGINEDSIQKHLLMEGDKLTKGLSTRMRIKMRIESEFSKFEFNSNEARSHAMRIAICSVNHTCSMRIIERIIGC